MPRTTATRDEIDSLKRQLEFTQESLRWRNLRLEDYREYYREDIACERKYRREDYEYHKNDLEWLRAFYRRETLGIAVDDNEPSEQAASPAIDVVTRTTNQKNTIAAAPHCLTSVRVVGEARLPTMADVLPLISSFVLSTRIPLDVAVGCEALHVTKWLLANGAEPTPMSLRVAVTKGNVTLFTVLLTALPNGPNTELLEALPLHKSTEISTWLTRAYPDQAAQLMMRLCSQQQHLLRDPSEWYSKRLKRQWEWETRFDEEEASRKKARLELWEREKCIYSDQQGEPRTM